MDKVGELVMKKYLEEIKVIALMIIALNTMFCLYYVFKERLDLQEQITTMSHTNQSLRRELDKQEEINLNWGRLFFGRIEDISLDCSEIRPIGLNAGDCGLEKGGVK